MQTVCAETKIVKTVFAVCLQPDSDLESKLFYKEKDHVK